MRNDGGLTSPAFSFDPLNGNWFPFEELIQNRLKLLLFHYNFLFDFGVYSRPDAGPPKPTCQQKGPHGKAI